MSMIILYQHFVFYNIATTGVSHSTKATNENQLMTPTPNDKDVQHPKSSSACTSNLLLIIEQLF